ncbi:MAG: hypothetical protein ACW98U_13870 [Candidatus Thorarchaeota archaeon]|jgi:hypothetical protein
MKTNLLKITSLVIGLVFVLSLLPQSAAAEVWSDDFNDLDDWTVTQGEWTAASQTLESVDDGNWRTYDIIWHESNTTTGTWSFYYQLFGFDEIECTTILFMANGTDSPFEYFGYGIRISDTNAFFVKHHGDYNRVDTYAGGVASFDDACGTWTKFDITRNSAGEFHVYINATSTEEVPAFSVNETEYDYSERLVIYHRGWFDACIDNLVVSDTIDIMPITPTTPTLTTNSTPITGETPPPDMTPLIAGAGGVVVLLVAVVFLKKR